MIGIGSAVGAGLKAVGSIIGGIGQARAMKRVKKNLEQQKKDNQNWFDQRYNEDFTQRADAQRILTNLNDSIRQRNRQAVGTNAVAGGTTASIAAAKASANQAIADTYSQLGAAANARKDTIENQYQAREASINNALNDLELKKGENIATAAAGVAQAGADIAGNLM